MRNSSISEGTKSGDTLSHREHIQSISRRVLDLITKNEEKTPVVFCQLDLLTKTDEEVVWIESARWVKYEEDVEENGKRWSKPHVSAVTLHYLLELKTQMSTGAIILEADVRSMHELAELISDELAKIRTISKNTQNSIRSILLSCHEHEQKRKHRATKMESNIITHCKMPKTISDTEFARKRAQHDDNDLQNNDKQETSPLVKFNTPFMKKIPDGAEVANVWVGELEGLKKSVTAFIRLVEPRFIGDLSQVALPTRFIFLHLTPKSEPSYAFEIGRAISNMMVDEIFSEVAYKAKSREDIMYGFDEFLDQLTVLPPGQWDPDVRLDPPTTAPSQERRIFFSTKSDSQEKDQEQKDDTLVRTGRLFGGLIKDVKRKIPFYVSDFRDGLHIQCIGSILFMYLATLAPNITFGAFLGQETEQHMGTMECLLAVAFVNLAFALFGGQPLIIMGSTGPVLVLEIIIYRMCRDNTWDFMSFRCMIGLWLALYLLIIVAFDLSALVRYITRFTEESFACLIAIIFIVESIKKIIAIADTHLYNTHQGITLDYTCYCVPNNQTENITTMPNSYLVSNSTMNVTIQCNSTKKEDCVKLGCVLEGSGCDTPIYHDNVFFLSIILGIGTFAIAWGLVMMKKSRFFPTIVRQTIGDFAVFTAICLMVLFDARLGVPTPKLMVPDKIQPSDPTRPWFISPFSSGNPWWTMLLASLPAIVAVILIFMDQQITAVIINRKENKLKKGCGYHLDLTVATICIVVCSFFGLPWYVAATVRSMSHVNSLKMESKCTAPGEKPVFLGCREQRLTPLVIAILNGCSVFMTKMLQLVPMPVLYGVFLYMGVSAFRGMQGMERIFTMNELKWLDDQNLEDKMMKQEDAGELIVEDDDEVDLETFSLQGNISWYLKRDSTSTGRSKEDILKDCPVEFLRNYRRQSTGSLYWHPSDNTTMHRRDRKIDFKIDEDSII
ncbi:Electrogenic sodium bicarbonate cotransporter 4,Electrogenic sodium bicarbonate cotransporter 1,Sodium-driven chloride bicarbonate exchanger,Sodium bicarbonate cotransporter 3,Electroneutral sodium bicarbonate exchanger 1 [Mytilus edulis]|uniref:Anion exchange protein n=1 Tax=Mytilus edulis TaxID=6550 RepID=A0A8S3R8E4_MYTED|nr:Electrogenic sodium bicarbonate cotransporter 4,Electrogenic sodium bicarbonate cotransporter 1,Sodium-driven chloride bicarbonate exchanger,Sodium bicarbonate cotransporter 3,Electroneutral sodium bicarbonate exchanger 1 [Mytilus edulis]